MEHQRRSLKLQPEKQMLFFQHRNTRRHRQQWVSQPLTQQFIQKRLKVDYDKSTKTKKTRGNSHTKVTSIPSLNLQQCSPQDLITYCSFVLTGKRLNLGEKPVRNHISQHPAYTTPLVLILFTMYILHKSKIIYRTVQVQCMFMYCKQRNNYIYTLKIFKKHKYFTMHHTVQTLTFV